MSESIVPVGSFAALTPSEGTMAIQDIVAINLGGTPIDPSMLDKVKVPSGGSLAWEVPGLDGEPEPTKEIVGVIIGVQNIRAYYQEEYSGGNEPPDCRSSDGITGETAEDGVEGYGGQCSTCPKSQWGSGPTGGQACSQRKLLFVLPPEATLPMVVNVPPTSLHEMNKYLLRLTSKGVPFYQVATSLKLRKVQSKSGIDYAQIAPGYVRKLDEDESLAAARLYQSLRGVFGQVAVDEVEAF